MGGTKRYSIEDMNPEDKLNFQLDWPFKKSFWSRVENKIHRTR